MKTKLFGWFLSIMCVFATVGYFTQYTDGLTGVWMNPTLHNIHKFCVVIVFLFQPVAIFVMGLAWFGLNVLKQNVSKLTDEEFKKQFLGVKSMEKSFINPNWWGITYKKVMVVIGLALPVGMVFSGYVFWPLWYMIFWGVQYGIDKGFKKTLKELAEVFTYRDVQARLAAV